MSVFEELLTIFSLEEPRFIKLEGKPQNNYTVAAPIDYDFDDTVVPPKQTNSLLPAMRLCFGRVLGNEYLIYDASDNSDYQCIGSPMLLDEAFPDGLRNAVVLPNGYGHICMYPEFSTELAQLVNEATGFETKTMLEVSDWIGGNDVVQIISDESISCVAHLEIVGMDVDSKRVPLEEIHSGTNVFGEATRVTLSINEKSVIMDNQLLVQLTAHPEKSVFFYENHTKIYMFSGYTLFKYSQLRKHVMALDNIDLTKIV